MAKRSRRCSARAGSSRATSACCRKPRTRTSPTFGNKKPIYTQLPFTVTAKGDLASIVDWIKRFYKLPLLHQIRNLSIQLPAGSDSSARRGANDLDMTVTVEALILDSAEAHKTLTPEKPVDLPSVLSPKDRQYASIAGKNIFYGSAPFSSPRRNSWMSCRSSSSTACRTRPARRPRLCGTSTTITTTASGRTRPAASGSRCPTTSMAASAICAVAATWSARCQWRHRAALDIVKIDDREMILKDEEHYYRLHIGQSLADMVALKADEVKSLGLKDDIKKATGEEEKAKDKEPDKDKNNG